MRRTAITIVLAFIATAGYGELRAGTNLEKAIRELQSKGVTILYSSDTIRPGMEILDEPTAKQPEAVLLEILAPWGLTTSDGPGGSLLIVRDEDRSTGRIRGTVRDAESGKALRGARIIARATEAETRTDKAGKFSLEVVPGRHAIEARLSGYIVATDDELVVRAGETTEVMIELVAAPVELGEIVVTPGHYSILEPQSKQFLGRQEVEQLPNIVDDVFRTLHRIPGAAAGDFSATSHIRGGEANEMLVLVDGFELYEPFHLSDFLGLFGVIDPQTIGNIELMTGGFPVEYGNRMGSVMDVTPIASTGSTRTSIGIDFVNSKLFNQGSFADGKGEWLASGRRGYIDLVLDQVDPDSGFDPSYWDIYGRVQYGLGERAIISANFLTANGTVDFDEDDAVARASYENDSFWINIRQHWRAGLFSETIASVASESRDRAGFDGDDYDVDDRRELDFTGLRQNWSINLGDRHYLKLGGDVRDLEAEYRLHSVRSNSGPILMPEPIPVETDLDLSPSGTMLGLYAADRVRLSDRLTAEAGVRWDRQSYVDDSQTSPRLHLVYSLTSATTIRGGWGRYHQPQRITELQVEDGISRFSPAQKSDQWNLGVETVAGGDISIRFEAYHKSISDLRPRYENLFDPVELFPEGKLDRVLVRPERARVSGVEILLRSRASRSVTWWLDYALSEAEDRIDGEWTPRSWDQRHAIGFSVNWTPDDRWAVNLAGRYRSGWPTTAISATWEIDSSGRVVVIPELGPRNGERLPDYKRLDVRVSRSVPTRTGALAFFVEVVNVLNEQNVCCIDELDIELLPDGETRLVPETTSWLPWIPTFGLRWEF